MRPHLQSQDVFDPAIADALGIARHSRGGSIHDRSLTFGTGDASDPDRTAWEGDAEISIDVPEPGVPLLLVIGMGSAIAGGGEPRFIARGAKKTPSGPLLGPRSEAR